MKFRFWVGLLALLIIMTACSSNSSPSGTGPGGTGALFVATQGDQMVSSFSANLSNGTLSTTGTSQMTDAMPSAMVLAPSGNALFVANAGAGDIESYTVNSDGSLTKGSTVGTHFSPTSLAIDPGGKLMFVACQGTPGDTTVVGTVDVFSVSGTTLTSVGSVSTTVPGAVNALPTAVAVSVQASASFLYVANKNDGTVSVYMYDAVGNLTAQSLPVTVGTAPEALAVTPTATVIPDGTFLYVANSGSNNISAFTIDPMAGTLTAVTNSPFSAGLGPASLAVSIKGKFLYCADKQSNQISSYTIDAVKGSLTATAPATTSTGVNPVWVAVHPAGTWVYVANQGSANVSILEIKTTGALGSPTNPQATSAAPSAIALK
jgi:6-phosphogluconolactonase (cycloisomerase 2 family)